MVNLRCLYFLLFTLLSFIYPSRLFAQCDSLVPVFTVDLSNTSSQYWISPDTVRKGNCCGTTHPDVCVKFIVTLPPDVIGILLDIYSGARPTGSLNYEVSCKGATSVGDTLCLNGSGPHEITFCKPGSNANKYIIRSFLKPQAGADISVNEGCMGVISATGYLLSSIRWNSVYPDTFGAYNKYLSCSTACATSNVLGQVGYPPYVLYQVCGIPNSSCFYSTVCDTVKVYFHSTLGAKILPEEPAICYGMTHTTLYATGSGGTPPYRFKWSTGDTVRFIDVDTGIYILTVYDSTDCPPAYDTVEVTAFSSNIEALAGKDFISCDTFAELNGQVLEAEGGFWTGGNGTFLPSKDSLRTTYFPTSQELNQGYVNLMLITTGNKSCPADTDEVRIFFRVFSDSLYGELKNISCFAYTDGAIKLSVIGNTIPYSFLWQDMDTSRHRINLHSGKYVVTVFDSGGCSHLDSFVLIQPDKLIVSHDSSLISCFGASDASITLNVSGGTKPYRYVWSNSDTSSFLINLLPGKYVVSITDSQLCEVSDSVIITEPSPLTFMNDVFHVKCKGNRDGSINITPSGGTSPYFYSWSDMRTSQHIDSLIAGMYILQITDSNYCEFTDTIYVNEPDTISVFNLIKNVICFGEHNGSIELNITGGTLPYTFLWNDNDTNSNRYSLVAGNYNLTLTDSQNCKFYDSFTISEPDALTISHDSAMISCYGVADGTATIFPGGGVLPYSIYWSNGGSTMHIENLGPGVYYVTLTDSHYCEILDSVLINEPYPLSLSAMLHDVKCFAHQDGQILTSVTGGTPPYQYLWSDNSKSRNLDSIQSGFYKLQVFDSNKCELTDSFVINEPTKIIVSGIVKHVCIGGNDGEIDITVDGGIKPYSFLWSNYQNTEDLKNLTKGDYEVLITDSNGCVLTDTFSVMESEYPLNLSLLKHDVKCHGNGDGIINVMVLGGTSPYYYRWSNGSADSILTKLNPGYYKLILTDYIGCSDSGSVIIEEPEALRLTYDIKNISCFGFNDGSITINVQGGNQPYKYSWSNGSETSMINSLREGFYVLTVTDSNGCMLTDTLEIKSPPELIVQKTIKDVSCYGENDGYILTEFISGTANIQKLWSTGSTTSDIYDLKAGLYVLTITEGNGCITKDTIFIDEPDQLNLLFTKIDEGCIGDKRGSIKLVIQGGTPPYQYSWKTGQKTSEIHSLSAGMYSCNVFDSNNCEVKFPETEIIAFQLPKPTIFPSGNKSYCIGDTVIIGIIENYVSYHWNNGMKSKEFTITTIGRFSAEVIDSNGCKGKSGESFIQRIDPKVHVTLKDKYKLCPRDSTVIKLIASSHHPSAKYYWKPSGDTTSSIIVSETGTYYVLVDIDGCKIYDSTLVYESCKPIIKVPNAFTPNNDGLNDLFVILTDYVDDLHYFIFDRWGEIIYRGYGLEDYWDGTLKGEIVPVGVFGIFIYYSNKDYGKFKYIGKIVVVR